MDISKEWKEAANRLLSEKGNAIFILGPLDSGKTTFAHFLIEEAISQNFRVAFLDADLGQSTLGPPGTIGLSLMQGEMNFALSALYFVGDISPRGHFLEVVVGTKKLAEKARKMNCDILIIDSSGLISFPFGYRLKFSKITLLSPSHVISLGASGDVNLILKSLPEKFEQICLPVSPQAQPVLRETRRELRIKAFRKYFSYVYEWGLPFQGLKFNPPQVSLEPSLYVAV